MKELTPHQKAALDYTRHISLTANAGSGKTFVLSHRYLEIAVQKNIPLRKIAAITFTDKAAGELYKKIADHLDILISASAGSSIRNKLESIRRQLVSANISTIHSFCIDILREYPVEAGLDANFIPIDEKLSDELIELSVDELIRSLLADPDSSEKIKYLIRLFGSNRIFTSELIRLIKNRKNVFHLSEKIYSKDIKSISQEFYTSFIVTADRIIKQNLDDLLDSIAAINRHVLSADKNNKTALEIAGLFNNIKNAQRTEELIDLLVQVKQLMLVKEGHVRQQGYLKKADAELFTSERRTVSELLKDFAAFVIPDNHSDSELELAKFGNILTEIFSLVSEIYDRKKAEQGYLDYEDILLFVRKILADTNVQKSLSQRFDFIMVDEYQDTNELQYNIFLPLLADLKRGNLFVVGDEKQSIYMFRDAELEVFDKTKKDIVNVSGDKSILSLPDSFRMAPAICLFTNYLFNRLFVSPNPFYNEVQYEDIVCARGEDTTGSVEILIADAEEENDESNFTEEITKRTIEPEADLTALKILQIINDVKYGLNFKDIAVLVRKRKSFDELEKAFVYYNIPFMIVGGRGFYQRQSVYDVYNYFSFLLDPGNDAALAGILRSPFFMIPDTKIFDISLEPGDHLWKKLKSYSNKDNLINRVFDKLNENLSLSRSYDPAAILRKILYESNYIITLASKPEGEQELANADKLLQLTIKFCSEDFRTLYDYVDYLKLSITKMTDEAQAAVADESDAVKIMTLHQAKGLEFPAVFLYKSGDYTRKDAVAKKSVTINKDFGLLTKVPLNSDYFSDHISPPLVSISDHITERKNYAELKRLFYVGVTRAMNHLFVSAGKPGKNGYHDNSFMGLLQKGLELDIESGTQLIRSELNFLLQSDKGFETITKKIALTIPITKNVENVYPVESHKKINIDGINLKHHKLSDEPKGEFISATKLVVFNQCPLKYKLIYVLGFKDLMPGLLESVDKNIQKADYDFSPVEDRFINKEEELRESFKPKYSALKGSIIHKILQDEIPLNLLDETIQKEIKRAISVSEYNEQDVHSLIGRISTEITEFYRSEAYKDLMQFPNYHNEYEIYSKERDDYLFGIVDKLILEKNKVIVVDYKTDEINPEEIEERAKNYSIQLKFYSYILSKLFENIDKFETRLIFIRHPEKQIIESFSKSGLQFLSDEIAKMITVIRERSYTKNKAHCKNCLFAINYKDCIVK